MFILGKSKGIFSRYKDKNLVFIIFEISCIPIHFTNIGLLMIYVKHVEKNTGTIFYKIYL